MVTQEALRPGVPFGVRNTGPVLGSDVEVVVLGPARWRQVRISDATVTAHRHRMRPRKSLLRRGPGHPAETAPQLLRQSLWCRVRERQVTEQRMNIERSPAAGQFDGTVEHLLSVHVTGGD